MMYRLRFLFQNVLYNLEIFRSDKNVQVTSIPTQIHTLHFLTIRKQICI